ncbi:MAG: gliding motility-associated C-terminal domain-containing protein [Bacteroidetes bacterium]|nr:gliding motility-associated C-terminal domain-containing protein [Bacteroidota bacterium]
MENERSKLGEAFKKAFEDYKPEPSPGVWENISHSPALQAVGKASFFSTGNIVLSAVSLTALVGAVLLITHLTGNKPSLTQQHSTPSEISIRPSTPVMQEKASPVSQSGQQSTAASVTLKNETRANEPKSNFTGQLSPALTPHAMMRTNIRQIDTPSSGIPSITLAEKTDVPSFPPLAPPKPVANGSTHSSSRDGNSSPGTSTFGMTPKNTINVIEDQNLCKGETATLWAEGGTTYTWSTGENTPSISVNPTFTTTYTITVTDHTGTPVVSSVKVTVVDCKLIYIPNAFTPNNDGKNDDFRASGQDIYDFHMRIVSRTGQILFESDDINKGWDGTAKGTPVEMGTYVYQITFIDANGKSHKLTGQVNLIK